MSLHALMSKNIRQNDRDEKHKRNVVTYIIFIKNTF